jgi:Na+-driven multidrug efflux pump
MISTDSVSSVAALGQVKTLLASFGSGLAAGGGIIVARYFGANKFDDAKKNANATFSIVAVVVGVLALICIPLAYPICNASGISSAQAQAATGYFSIQIIELVFVAFNNVFIALQKAKGNTKSIFYLNLLTMIVKLVFNVTFIFVFKVDKIIWIAVATLLSQIFLFSVLAIMVLNKNNIFRIELKSLNLKWDLVKPILAISIPIFIGKFVFSFGKVAVNSIFGEQYKNILLSQIDTSNPSLVAQAEASAGLVVGALAVSNNINGIATSPINSFEEGESTIVSQNLGNNNVKRAIEAFFKTFIITSILGVVCWVLIRFTFQHELINLFKGDVSNASQAEEFMMYIKQIHDYDALSIPSLAICAAVLGVLYGFGKTKTTAFINIARAFIFRIPTLLICLLCFPELGVKAAGISMAISNIGIALMSIAFLLVFLIKLKRNNYENV